MIGNTKSEGPNITTYIVKSRLTIAASEALWRLPSPPTVGEKYTALFCKFKCGLLYKWIAKPFRLPLQLFGNTKMKNKQWIIKADWKSPPLRQPGGSRRRQ